MNSQRKKFLFIDRDGTLIVEPEDQQVDSIDKLTLMPGVIPALLGLKQAGYSFVMVTNQDGLGGEAFPEEKFLSVQNVLLRIFSSQNIQFESIRICSHWAEDCCDCRKPKVGLVMDYLVDQTIDRNNSYVIGDRQSDLKFAENLGLKGILFEKNGNRDWINIMNTIINKERTASLERKTSETSISVSVNLDNPDSMPIHSGIRFLDHMLDQLSKHSGIGLSLIAKGDVDIDDHHTVEDIAIVLGSAIHRALGDKYGIARYGFMLPMDESLAHVALDLSGRFYCEVESEFLRERVGDLSTELVPHFFKSFAEHLKATLHIKVQGENAHHMIEAMFKCVGRALGQAIKKADTGLPSTKGVL